MTYVSQKTNKIKFKIIWKRNDSISNRIFHYHLAPYFCFFFFCWADAGGFGFEASAAADAFAAAPVASGVLEPCFGDCGWVVDVGSFLINRTI